MPPAPQIIIEEYEEPVRVSQSHCRDRRHAHHRYCLVQIPTPPAVPLLCYLGEERNLTELEFDQAVPKRDEILHTETVRTISAYCSTHTSHSRFVQVPTTSTTRNTTPLFSPPKSTNPTHWNRRLRTIRQNYPWNRYLPFHHILSPLSSPLCPSSRFVPAPTISTTNISMRNTQPDD